MIKQKIPPIVTIENKKVNPQISYGVLDHTQSVIGILDRTKKFTQKSVRDTLADKVIKYKGFEAQWGL